MAFKGTLRRYSLRNGNKSELSLNVSTVESEIIKAQKDTIRAKKSKEAAARQLLQNTTCYVCSKGYDKPKVLPCTHVFCSNCLLRYINPKQLVSCPLCHRDFHVHNGDPKHLPDSDDKEDSVAKAIRELHRNSTVKNNKASAVDSCTVCGISLLKEDKGAFCLHCQKVLNSVSLKIILVAFKLECNGNFLLCHCLKLWKSP